MLFTVPSTGKENHSLLWFSKSAKQEKSSLFMNSIFYSRTKNVGRIPDKSSSLCPETSIKVGVVYCMLVCERDTFLNP
jgi:hypothetical protein